jgi:transcriptional regulator with XRE-family HTH domain
MVTKNDIDSRFRQNLIRLRQKAGLSQKDLAKYSGVTHIAQIESGARAAGNSVMNKLANTLDVDISEFFRPDEEVVEKQAPSETLMELFLSCSPEGQRAILLMVKIFLEYERKTKIF